MMGLISQFTITQNSEEGQGIIILARSGGEV